MIRFLTNQSGLYDTEQLEEAMQKVMDTYAGGISNHYQFNENQLNLAEEKIEKVKGTFRRSLELPICMS